MAQKIRTVAVIGCGVIGSSWAALFLSRGLRVIVVDPIQGAEQTFQRHLNEAWPVLKANGAHEDASPDNYEFVNEITSNLIGVDFVQEVTYGHLVTSRNRFFQPSS